MARIRTVKPELFRHEELYELEVRTKLPIRVAWMGLFTAADREGRFKWQPNILKLDILPWDKVDFEKVLEALRLAGFIKCYSVNGKSYGLIPSFKEHQRIKSDEAQSVLPQPPADIQTDQTTVGTEPDRIGYEPEPNPIEPESEETPIVVVEGKGREKEEEGNNKPAETSFAGNHPLLESEFTKPLLDRVKRDVQDAWIQTYEDVDWIRLELKKAITWCKTKPKRAPKSDYQKFMTDWLARGWESHRKKNLDGGTFSINTTPIDLEAG